MIQAGQRVKVRFSHPSKHFEWREGEVYRVSNPIDSVCVKLSDNRFVTVHPASIKEVKQ